MKWMIAVMAVAAIGCKSAKSSEPEGQRQVMAPTPVETTPPPQDPEVGFHCSGRRASIDINKADPEFSDRVVLDCAGGPRTVERFVQLDRKKPDEKVFEVEVGLFEAAWARIEKTEWKTLGETCDGLPRGDLYVNVEIQDGSMKRTLKCDGVSNPVLVDLAAASEWIATSAAKEGSRVEVAMAPPPDDLPQGVDEAYAPPALVELEAEPIEDTRGWKLTSESLGPLTLGMEVEAVNELGKMPKVKLWAQKGLICSIVLEQAGVATEEGPGVGETLGEFREAYGAVTMRQDRTVVAGPYVLAVKKRRKLPSKLEGRRGKKALKLKVATVAVDQCEPPPAPSPKKKRR